MTHVHQVAVSTASYRLNTTKYTASPPRNAQLSQLDLVKPNFDVMLKKWQKCRVFFLTASPNFQCQNEKTGLNLQATFIVKKAPRWLSKIFHLGSEKREEQLKKPLCIY